jgi:RNA polymerase sigma factor (sigma-70 family)
MLKIFHTSDKYSRLIVNNLEFIKKQCRRAVAQGMSADEDYTDVAYLDNETDQLLNAVLDRLKDDNYRVLREFHGESKLTTYITTIITNLTIDIVRAQKGRNRARERARALGKTAELLYEMVYLRRLSVKEAQTAIEVTYGVHEPLEKLHDLINQMRGRSYGQVHVFDGTSWMAPGHTIVDDDGEIKVEVVDSTTLPDEQLISGQRQALARQTINDLLQSLTGEEQLMLRLRFPANETESPQTIRYIGNMLGLSEKVVDSRIRRLLNRLREMLIKQGLGLDDLIDE